MHFLRYNLIIAFIFLCGYATYGQKYSLNLRQIVAHPYFFEKGYQFRYAFNSIDVLAEREFENQRLSLELNLIYARLPPKLPPRYSAIFESDDFYDKSIAFGLTGRIYTRPAAFRGFFQSAIYLNQIYIKQPIVVPYGYGVYTEIIDYRGNLWGTTIAAGWGIYLRHIAIETYIQYGISQIPGKMRGEQFFLGSVGLQNQYRHGAWLFSPFNIKWLIPGSDARAKH